MNILKIGNKKIPNIYKVIHNIYSLINNKCDKYSNIIHISGIIVFKIIFDVTYKILLSPLYCYMGFVDKFNLIKYLISWIFYILMIPLIIKIANMKIASSYIITFLNYLYFIPGLTLYAFIPFENRYFILVSIYWVSIIFLEIKIPYINFKKNTIENANKLFNICTIFSIIFIFYISWKYTGLRLTMDIFIHDYEIRAEALTYNIGMIVTYILDAMPLIMGLMLIYYISKKSYLVVSIIMFAEILLYSIACHKTIFFLPILIIIFYVFYRNWMLPLLPWGFSFIGILSLVEKIILNTPYILSFSYRRTMLVPALLSNDYYNYFKDKPFDVFRSGILRRFHLESPYQIDIVKLIGYSNGGNANANNGLVGDMFANLGFWGILIMPLMLVIIFRLYDFATEKMNSRIFIGIILFMTNSFINTSWSTVLLTHGYLCGFILLYLYPQKKGVLENVQK